MAFVELNRASVLRDGIPILDGIDLKIEEGCHTAILGPNGSGKSTLMKLLSCQIYPLAREQDPQPVLIFGRARWDVFDLRRNLGIVSSDMHQSFVLDDGLTALDAVVSGFFASQGMDQRRRITPRMEAAGYEALELMGAANLAQRFLGTLSTGEARRVLVARALAPRPAALLLDEPTTALDLASRFHLLETLQELAVTGTTLILVTHHVEEIVPEIDRVLILKEGKIAHEGSKHTILTESILSESFGVPVKISLSGGYVTAAHNG